MLANVNSPSKYVGMGAAVLICGRSRAVKMKITSVLTQWHELGWRVVGVRLKNMDWLKARSCSHDWFFVADGLEYVRPDCLFRSRREALEWCDRSRMDELLARKKEISDRLEDARRSVGVSESQMEECDRKIEETRSRIQARPWNRLSRKHGKETNDKEK